MQKLVLLNQSQTHTSHMMKHVPLNHLIIFFYIVTKAIKETSTKEDSMSEATLTFGNYDSFTV